MDNLFFWWSIVSTVLGVLLLAGTIWQYLTARNEREKTKAQVKVWMQDANGVSQSLSRIVSDNLAGRYSSTNDVCNTIWSVQANAFALYQSLYEERCVTEEEYKARQKKLSDKLEANQLASLEQQGQTHMPPTVS
ncbi:MAG: hypothetical protein B7W98_01550 [Parcubacteria group bacterium 20-58-5]|nr:MAG: hypothetical protein B7W98_01550 [Parcubacteria group bacterium 20-58-5]HQT82558.1 hypothetical protein [Candidatus Paceibacterota bacterium]